ncbi:male accessory gland serine protease inhibitor-like [Scaptodrosophila lebanonensis]|uniref:Male accessory gland serine protease inhibitor-like n=1 Tax=Drosophila lebanonensis TaxID=7225 RepID=A0A6J2U9R9_DROLE|nr:male accessory gland serine protease inhibitor-like [Scaptodrosophila lebanonensis]
MKFLILLVAVATIFASACALKNEICGLEHSLNGDGRISCEAYIPSWSYNAAANECVSFIFGGCGGNANRFASQDQCESKCKE